MLIKGSNQTLKIETGKDLTGVSSPKIRYKKPGGSVGVFDATASGTIVSRKFETGDLDVEGVWEFQPEITSSGDLLLGRDKRKVIVTNPIPLPQ